MPDSLIIRCPHCNHALRLPADFLGRTVTCLECKHPFRAPVKDGDALTPPVPLAPSRTVPARLFIPLFGLLVLGTTGLSLNAYLLSNPAAAKAYARSAFESLMVGDPPEKAEWKQADAKQPPDDEELKRRAAIMERHRNTQMAQIDKALAEMPEGRGLRWFGLVSSILVLLGGFAFLFRRFYALAFLGSFAAAILSPDLGCCFFGVIIAIWGFMALISDEGRRYFRIADTLPSA